MRNDNNEQIYYTRELPEELRIAWISRYGIGQYVAGSLAEWVNEFKELGFTEEYIHNLLFPMVFGGKE